MKQRIWARLPSELELGPIVPTQKSVIRLFLFRSLSKFGQLKNSTVVSQIYESALDAITDKFSLSVQFLPHIEQVAADNTVPAPPKFE